MKHLLKAVALLSAVLMLTSCFNMKINLNGDKKSGTIAINYSFDDDDFDIISLAVSAMPVAENSDPLDPSVLLDQDEFKNYFDSIEQKDLKLKQVTITKKKDKTTVYTGTVVFEFSDFQSALAKIPATENGFKLLKEKDIITLEQVVDFTSIKDMETLDNYLALVKKDKPVWFDRFAKSPFNLEINTKTPIINSKGVILSADKKKVTYSFKAGEVITDKKKYNFMVKF